MSSSSWRFAPGDCIDSFGASNACSSQRWYADSFSFGITALDIGIFRAAADGDLAFNLTWHDWLNLKNLILVSRAIAAAARAREDSRGAHFRADFPRSSDLNGSRYTSVRLSGDSLAVTSEPVSFTRVRPGESLIRDAAE